MIEKIKAINNPPTMIEIFAVVAEIALTFLLTQEETKLNPPS